MFDALRSFLNDMTSGAPATGSFEPDDTRLAAVALLVHLANADGVLEPAERDRLEQLVEERFALAPPEARQLIAQASAQEREAVDLFHFTHVLKRRLDAAGRLSVVEALWEMAYADGAIHELEESIIARVAELLAVSARERVEMKQRAERRGPQDVAPASPWGTRGAS